MKAKLSPDISPLTEWSCVYLQQGEFGPRSQIIQSRVLYPFIPGKCILQGGGEQRANKCSFFTKMEVRGAAEKAMSLAQNGTRVQPHLHQLT